jgi:NAD-reducing hydrogenase small subunit
VAFGDCATTGNVTAMRNKYTTEDISQRAYIELADKNPLIPNEYITIAKILKNARPLHEVIKVDAWLHGCPPTSDQIWSAVTALLKGEKPVLSPAYLRYG